MCLSVRVITEFLVLACARKQGRSSFFFDSCWVIWVSSRVICEVFVGLRSCFLYHKPLICATTKCKKVPLRFTVWGGDRRGRRGRAFGLVSKDNNDKIGGDLCQVATPFLPPCSQRVALSQLSTRWHRVRSWLKRGGQWTDNWNQSVTCYNYSYD